ncbi:MAG: hypothetical protein R8J94_09710 [Acidimicrobiia bacterium]|nr:hypothetical protein [Acidimicrobiia bacterium]
MTSVVVRIPISPSPNYLNRSVLLAHSAKRAGGELASARIQAFVSPDRPAPPRQWVDHAVASGLEWNGVPADRFAEHSYGATGIERFMSPVDADVLVLADADLIFTGSLDDAIERSRSEGVLLGVTAYRSPFVQKSFGPRVSEDRRTCWKLLFDAVGVETPEFTSTHPSAYEQEWEPDVAQCPPYFNYGMLVMPPAVGARLGSTLYEEHRRITTHFRGAHSGQLALATALARKAIGSGELPIRFNFPNQEPYVDAYPGDYGDVRVLHYMSPGHFDKETDLDSMVSIEAWLGSTPKNRVHARLAEELHDANEVLAACPWNTPS